jgi:hypothetical protein
VTRDYDEFLGRIFDHVGPAAAAMLLLVLAGGAGLLWYGYPAWLGIRLPGGLRWRPRWRKPRWRRPSLRWPRFRWPRFRWPRRRWPRRSGRAARPATAPAAAGPESPVRPPVAAGGLSTADRLAAEGRYAEAIRERLRESVTTLTRHGVVTPAPAWTAHEVAATAGRNRPAVSAPLTGATDVFAEVWYGHRPAGPDQDATMRRLTAEVRAALEGPR